MNSTPAMEAAASLRPVATGGPIHLALQALMGFSAMLAAQACASDLSAMLACFLGIAMGAIAAAELMRTGRIPRPWRAYGVTQLAMGASCLALSPLAPLAAVFLGGSLAFAGRKCYLPALGGALAASLASPAIGPQAALWICVAIGVAICGVTAFTPAPENIEEGRSPQPVLAAAFGCGAMLSALVVIWRHLAQVAIAENALPWVDLAVVLGLFVGAVLVRNIRWSLLFASAAVLLMAQYALWDRVPSILRAIPSELCVSVLLLAPVAAILGAILPRLLGPDDNGLAGYLWGLHALGWLTGALLTMLVLVPLAGAELSLKALVLVLVIFWAAFLVREPLSHRRIATSAAIAVVMSAVLLGRWWNWGLLTAGHAPTQAASSSNTHYLPPSFIFKSEDLRGGFTTVVEQTVVTGEVGHTIRTLFRNGLFRGDDASPESPFLPGPQTGSALLAGLGTGRNAAVLKTLGYREIVVSEASPGIVKAARASFGGFNEGILGDSRVKLYLDDAREVLANHAAPFDLIAIDAGGESLDSREFFRLAKNHLRPGGLLEISGRTDPGELPVLRAMFSQVDVRHDRGPDLILASDKSLPGLH